MLTINALKSVQFVLDANGKQSAVQVSMDDWREQVLRCAEKAGRAVRDWQIMTPGADFPSQDQQPPLKTLILQL